MVALARHRDQPRQQPGHVVTTIRFGAGLPRPPWRRVAAHRARRTLGMLASVAEVLLPLLMLLGTALYVWASMP